MFTTDDKSPREVADLAAAFAQLNGHEPVRQLDGPGMVLVECEACHEVGAVTAERCPGGEAEVWRVQDAAIFRVHPDDRCDPRRRDEPPS